MAGKAPIYRLRYGTVNCSLWFSGSPLGGFYDAVFTRTFRRGDTWARARHFGELDLPTLAKAAMDAHTWIQTHKQPEVVNLTLPDVECDCDVDTGYDADNDATDLKHKGRTSMAQPDRPDDAEA